MPDVIGFIQKDPASGAVLINPSTRLPCELGSVQTGTTSGSVTHSGFAQGEPYWVVTNAAGGGPTYCYTPAIHVTGNTLYWTFESVVDPIYRQNCVIEFGVF